MSEFSYPRANFIVASSGFSVEVRGRSMIRYEEEGKAIEIFAEILGGSGPPRMIVRRGDVQAWQGSELQADLSESERDRIIANIRRAFAFKDWILLVE